MKDIVKDLQEELSSILETVYNTIIKPDEIIINHTKKEFEGQYTVVIYPLVRILRKKPEELAADIANELLKKKDYIQSFTIVKGFLNLSIHSSNWIRRLKDISNNPGFGTQSHRNEKVLIEFSSPNTNKPLHLGHIRNILLGLSCANIFRAAGYDVTKTQIVNDRGIAICKSMLAWERFGDGQTPESTGLKPDHFVGEYYVRFDKEFVVEYENWQQSDEALRLLEAKAIDITERAVFFNKFKNQYFNKYSNLGSEVKQMLRNWEAKDKKTLDLWSRMNTWVLQGFESTYKELSVSFDSSYFESKTYTLGKSIIKEGLDSGVFFKKEDGSVWVNLEDVGLDEKILLRSDGTSVYLTQDLGTAELRYKDHKAERMIYVVGDEQDYHFQVLFEVLKKLNRAYAPGLFHLSYGMVDLPEGKMKSREGTVVDADDLIAEVIDEANKSAIERGELSDLSVMEQKEVIRKIGMAALKFFILKVQAKKRMVFNPKESVDMQGQTGPYIQNAYVRVQSILRKKDNAPLAPFEAYELGDQEKLMVRELLIYPSVVLQAAEELNPSGIANYCYGLAKAFHKYYHDFRILNAETEEAKAFRLKLAETVATVLKGACELLGIEMPEKM